jgi:uncharacterized protein (TIGR03083 family)
MTMPRDDYLDVIRTNGEALIAAAERAPSADVRYCPEWAMPDLLWHIAEVHLFWSSIASGAAVDPSEYEEPPRPSDDELPAFASEQLANLLRVLEAADPSTEVFSWAPQKDVAFIIRRMAHETIIHRWDAEDAAGVDATIDADLASDGVDEFLSFFLRPIDVEPGSVHLHATDTPGEWLVRFGEGAPRVTREHAKGDAALRGGAAELILGLWQRVPQSKLEVIGDSTAVDRLMTIAGRG